jgi:HAE1 family hydrophobic/amphiphilic exporter-1
MLGRTLNVISLAGIAFSVGILVDTAIVVLENIDRHMKMGKSPRNASLDAVGEVWGAVLASTLTTVAVFLPVVFIQQEAGQLFRDIAIAISASVILSLLVSIFVIPVLTRLIYERLKDRSQGQLSLRIGEFGDIFTRLIMQLSVWINASNRRKLATIGIFVAFSVLGVWILIPKMEYLPQGNMNMVRSSFNLPSGLSLEERTYLADIFYNEVKPYINNEVDGNPAIAEFIYNVNQGGMSATAIAEDPERAVDLVPLLSGLMQSVPGVTGYTSQNGIFQSGGGGSRSLNVAISGEDINQLIEVAKEMMGLIRQSIPDAQVRPQPSLEMLYPEATIFPRYQQLGEAGLSPEDLGVAIDAFVDGRKVGEFRDAELGNIDMLLTYPTANIVSPEDVAMLPVSVRGGAVPIANVSELMIGFGMDGISRYERKRTFTLRVTPPTDMVLEEVMQLVRDDVVAPLETQDKLQGIDVRYTGSASKLVEARDVLLSNFLLALIITYLLMSALFDNFFYPFIIMFSVPLAMAGGFIGLALVNAFVAFQPLDILTMLGFVILVGVVVNNAILIVHQSLNNIRMYGMAVDAAITESVSSRLRPIFMGAATSLFGMLPLVLFPGPGSELYRGLGSVVLGGLTISTMFTVFLVPALLSLTMNKMKFDTNKN